VVCVWWGGGRVGHGQHLNALPPSSAGVFGGGLAGGGGGEAGSAPRTSALCHQHWSALQPSSESEWMIINIYGGVWAGGRDAGAKVVRRSVISTEIHRNPAHNVSLW
jgi:hypothetical protein